MKRTFNYFNFSSTTTFSPPPSSMLSTFLSTNRLMSQTLRHRPLPTSLKISTTRRLHQMTSHLSGAEAGTATGPGVSLSSLPKSNVFTSKLPPDPSFETPLSSHKAPRETLGPRMVRGALYTYVRPEPSEQPELLGVSSKAMKDLGLKEGEEKTEEFKALVSGNKIEWDEENGGVYPWAQCYGGK